LHDHLTKDSNTLQDKAQADFIHQGIHNTVYPYPSNFGYLTI